MTEPEPMTKERLQALATEIMTVVRHHAPDWTDRNDPDPGITLVELLAWLADALSAYQYVVETGADGVTTIRFGDGVMGARPAAGREVTATYRPGVGAVELTVTVRWPREADSADDGFGRCPSGS